MRVNEQLNAKKNKQNQLKRPVMLFQGKKHDFQYSVFTIGASTKIIGGLPQVMIIVMGNYHSSKRSFWRQLIIAQSLRFCMGMAYMQTG